ncbi:MAG: cytochrome-c peroxidase, partial [Anaerolineae bacterium]|nr:cytochrome-c peroxidase [Anaerolineae bacterium]
MYKALGLAALFIWLFSVTVALAQGPTESADTLPTPILPTTAYNYTNIALPDYFNSPQLLAADNTPGNNPLTNAGATLGRVLFYDKRLSANNTVACASCHHQANGFSDTNRLSLGFAGGLTGRNSMGLANARYYQNGAFFWDERAASLEIQTLRPIQDSVEMGLTLDELVAKVAAESYYPPLFEQAFG